MRDERKRNSSRLFGRRPYGLSEPQLADLHERARRSVEDLIWRTAGACPPRTEHYWAWLTGDLTNATVLGLCRTPQDWDVAVNGPFQGRVRGDPHDPDSRGCRIEYLATGAVPRRIARIVHELAEFLLILRLPTLLDGDEEAGFGIHYGGSAARDERHELARSIELDALARLFPEDLSITPRRRMALGLTAMRWHIDWRNNPSLYKPEIERCLVEGVDYGG